MGIINNYSGCGMHLSFLSFARSLIFSFLFRYLELENIMLSIASLLHIIPKESSAKLLSSLCTTVLAGTVPTNARQRLRL